ncbi:TetR/AcrR family transcriptional regulator [Krasilnikovia sp. MM14-A1259]|uniref:TetR/AcrR family transcriptional regulator n=1 Tax=Krasilnikovia sp. MM14-A1259 TaxID=3373539 RepID=UPI00382EEC5C
MARPRTFDVDAAARAARDVFWRRGYEATSLADLEQATGLNRSSLYQAFDSKHGLFQAAVRQYLDEVATPRLAVLESPGAGLAALVAYLRQFGEALRATRNTGIRGCMIVNAIAEVSDRDPWLREYGAEYRTRILDALTGALRTAAGHGEIAPERTDQRARTITAVVMGALVTAHLDARQAAEILEDTADEVETWRIRRSAQAGLEPEPVRSHHSEFR